MSSRSASTGVSTRSTRSARCSASRAALRRRPMPTFIPARGPILHLAGVCVNRIGTDRSIDGPGEFIETNIVGTFVLLQEALRHWRSLAAPRRDGFRLLHVSTDEIYGTLGPEGSKPW